MTPPSHTVWDDRKLLGLLAMLDEAHSAYQQVRAEEQEVTIRDRDRLGSTAPDQWHLSSSPPSPSSSARAAPEVWASQRMTPHDDAFVFSSVEDTFTIFPAESELSAAGNNGHLDFSMDFESLHTLDHSWHKLLCSGAMVNASILSLASPMGYYCLTAASMGGRGLTCDLVGGSAQGEEGSSGKGSGSEIYRYVEQISAHFGGLFDGVSYLTEHDSPRDMYDVVIGGL
jgi:hypothetical protein